MTKPLDLNTTYEDLMERKLADVDPTLDKRELTSMIFNAIAANSAETVQMLVTLQNYVDMLFADTAPRESLIRLGLERGLSPDPAQKAQLRAIFNKDVPLGARFSLDQLNYIVTERISAGEFILECETEGEVGNQFLGTLIPVEYIDGLTSAELVEVLIPGEEEEDTEAFRERYINSFDAVAFGGNRADYKEKVLRIPGVGGVRLYRTWNGVNTVKLVFIDSQYKRPQQLLIDRVQQEVDPLHAQGEGEGIAPVNHIVSVFGASETLININLQLTFRDGYSWETVKDDIEAAIENYFTELAKEWAKAVTYEDDETGVVVRISQIESRLLNVNGVLDVTNTTLNGGTANIEIDKEAIPKQGVISNA